MDLLYPLKSLRLPPLGSSPASMELRMRGDLLPVALDTRPGCAPVPLPDVLSAICSFKLWEGIQKWTMPTICQVFSPLQQIFRANTQPVVLPDYRNVFFPSISFQRSRKYQSNKERTRGKPRRRGELASLFFFWLCGRRHAHGHAEMVYSVYSCSCVYAGRWIHFWRHTLVE